VVALLRLVGERWWVTGVALYLPRFPLAAPLPVIALFLAMARLHRYLWTQIVAALAVALPLMGFPLRWPGLHAHDTPALRVLSYNINAAAGGIESVADEIERYSPDIVLLQEVADVQALTARLRTRYPTVNSANQFLLASRYPVSSTVEPDKLDYGGHQRSPRYLQQTLETPLGRIAIYNVHPISPRDSFYALRGNGLRGELLSGRLFSSAGAAVFKANSGLRALQVETFAQAAKRETSPVIIAGDTNLPGLSYVFGRNLAAYQDGFAEAGLGFGYTYPTNRRPWMRIDRILASEQLRFLRFEVGTSLASDHLCVVADLGVRSALR
jgi:vancomycin resistance protein VanJ